MDGIEPTHSASKADALPVELLKQTTGWVPYKGYKQSNLYVHLNIQYIRMQITY